MATLFVKADARVGSLAPNWYDKALSGAAMLLLAAVIVALGRGYPQWGQVPGIVWGHLATVLVALVLTPWMLLRPRGTPTHRLLGKAWVTAMVATAALSLFVKVINPGHFSVIHLLSIVVLAMAPRVWLTARAHQVARHRATVRGLATGALLIAGFFTLPPFRLLGGWLLG
jgi:uncharacterized membrane protein